MRFRKRPVVVEALQWTGKNWNKVEAFIGRGMCSGWIDGNLNIETLEGKMKATCGDWIIKGVKGKFYSCKPDIFEQTYEPVDEPKPVCDHAFERTSLYTRKCIECGMLQERQILETCYTNWRTKQAEAESERQDTL